MMRIALYIEDGLEQIVLTPETETERGIVGKLHDGGRRLLVKSGQFYVCQGGWVRHSEPPGLYGSEQRQESTILVLRPIEPGQDSGEHGRG